MASASLTNVATQVASSTTTSARAPASSRPRSSSPSTRGRRRRSPSPPRPARVQPVNATRLRTASSSVRRCRRARRRRVRTPVGVDGRHRPRRGVDGPSRCRAPASASVTRIVRLGRAPATPCARRSGRRGCRRRSGRRHDVVGERRADRAGVAVPERTHGVEQVGDIVGAGALRPAANSAAVSVGVAERHDDTDGRRATRSRRGHRAAPARWSPAATPASRDHPSISAARGQPPAAVGVGAVAGRRRASGPRGAGPSGTAPRPRSGAADGVERPPPRVGRAGDDRRQERRHAVLGAARRRARRSLRLGGEVDAVAAVDLQVDEARRHDQAGDVESSRVIRSPRPAGVMALIRPPADHDVDAACSLRSGGRCTTTTARAQLGDTVVMARFLPDLPSRDRACRPIGTERTDLDPRRRQRDVPAHADRGEERRRAFSAADRVAGDRIDQPPAELDPDATPDHDPRSTSSISNTT